MNDVIMLLGICGLLLLMAGRLSYNKLPLSRGRKDPIQTSGDHVYASCIGIAIIGGSLAVIIYIVSIIYILIKGHL